MDEDKEISLSLIIAWLIGFLGGAISVGGIKLFTNF